MAARGRPVPADGIGPVKIPYQYIDARDLRRGDLMRCGAGTTYVLIARAWIGADGRVKGTIYHGASYASAPTVDLAPDAKVALTGRDLRPFETLRRCRADKVHCGEHILVDGRRREVTDGRRSQRRVLFWLDGNLGPNPDLQFLEDEMATVIV